MHKDTDLLLERFLDCFLCLLLIHSLVHLHEERTLIFSKEMIQHELILTGRFWHVL